MARVLKRRFVGVALVLSLAVAEAAVFDIPRSIAPDEFAIGLEPEVVLTSPNSAGSGAGVNMRYSHGLTDTNKVVGIVGTGGGPRRFRAGGALTFDFFPDYGDQPGVGIAIQGLFVELPNAGSLEITGVPYVHKTFSTQYGFNFSPFVAIPIGLSLSGGNYQSISSAVIGTQFIHNSHFSSVVELGVSINQTNTYFSGGLIYYH